MLPPYGNTGITGLRKNPKLRRVRVHELYTFQMHNIFCWHDFTLSLSLSESVRGQSLPDFGIPDSSYVPNQLLVWFRDGALNLEMLGGYGEMPDYPHSDAGKEPLPLNETFILSGSLLTYLQQRGVSEMYKVVPWMDPFRDTMTITRGGDTIREHDLWNILLLEFLPGAEVNPVFEAYYLLLAHHDKIRWAQPNFLYEYGSTPHGSSNGGKDRTLLFPQPNDSLYNKQRSLHNTVVGIFADSAWSYNTSRTDVRIGIIDDGIFDNNPDFQGKIAEKKNYGSAPGPKSHGTDMAGIIGARKDNTVGVVGIAGGNSSEAGSQLYILDVYDPNPSSQSKFSIPAIFDAIAEASMATTSNKGFGCQAVNISLFTSIQDKLLRAGVAMAYARGSVISACMGNTGRSDTLYPAAIDDHYVIAVGAKGENHEIHRGSTRGSHMDFLGPGWAEHIWTTWDDSDWGRSGGMTSAATAHTTGVVALLISEYLNSGTNVDKPYTPEDIENLLEAGCVDRNGTIQGTYDMQDSTGWGYLRASNSLAFLHDPYVLRHDSTTMTVNQLPVPKQLPPDQFDFEDVSVIPSRKFIVTNVEQYTFKLNVTYPFIFQSIVRSWGRGNQRSGKEGYAPPSIRLRGLNRNIPYSENIFSIGYTGVSAWDTTSCELETHFYRGKVLSGAVRWFPYDPLEQQIKFYYSVLGIPAAVGVGKEENRPASLLIQDVHPNPTVSSHVNVRYFIPNRTNDIRLYVTDLLGRTRFHKTISNPLEGWNQTGITTAGFPAGVYLLSLEGGGQRVARTITILH